MTSRNTPKHILRTLIIICSLLLLSGCFPPDYSKDYAKAQAKEHLQDAKQWFADNYPEAKVSSSCESLNDGRNLMAAVSGKYSTGISSHRYIYDFVSDLMYLDEDYQETCNALKEETCRQLGVPEDHCVCYFNGITITGQCANDNEDAAKKAGEPISMYRQEYLPASMDAAAFATETLKGNTDLAYSISCYVEQIPPLDKQMSERFPNVTYIKYVQPADTVYDGQYASLRYSAEWYVDTYCHLEQIGDGMYAGYICEVQTKDSLANVDSSSSAASDYPDRFAYTKDSEQEFTIEIPEGADLILLSETKLKPVHSYLNSGGKPIESELRAMDKSKCPGMPEYTQYGADLVLPTEKLNGYRQDKVGIVNGKYHIVMK